MSLIGTWLSRCSCQNRAVPSGVLFALVDARASAGDCGWCTAAAEGSGQAVTPGAYSNPFRLMEKVGAVTGARREALLNREDLDSGCYPRLFVDDRGQACFGFYSCYMNDLWIMHWKDKWFFKHWQYYKMYQSVKRWSRFMLNITSRGLTEVKWFKEELKVENTDWCFLYYSSGEIILGKREQKLL